MIKNKLPELNEVEKREPYAEYYNRALAEIPPKIVGDLESGPCFNDDALPFEKDGYDSTFVQEEHKAKKHKYSTRTYIFICWYS